VNRSCFLNLAAWRTRSSACDTRARHCVRFVLCWFAFPRPRPWLTGSAAVLLPALFVGFPATLARSDFLGSVHHRLRLLAFPMRPVVLSGQTQDLPVPIRRACAHARVSDHAEPGGRSRCRLRSYCFPRQRPCLRSEQESFSRLYGWPVRTLSTLRRRPHGRLRMTRATVVRYSFSAVDSHHLLLAGFAGAP